VLFCGAGRSCIRVPGGCNLLSVSRDGAFGEPEDLADKARRIAEGFPFVRAQDQLLPPFQTGTRGCGEENDYQLAEAVAPVESRSDDAPISVPDPEPEPEPAPEPPDFNPAE
jgi:hypothetical protein